DMSYVIVSGSSVGAVARFTFDAVTVAHALVARLAFPTRRSSDLAGDHGAISPVGAVSVDHGANREFTITPDAHYHIADVLVDGNTGGADARITLKDVTPAHTIASNLAIDTYTITA